MLLVLVGSAWWYYQANYAASLQNITNQAAVRDDPGQNGATSGNNQTQNNTASDQVLTGNRINILLLGSDNDAKFASGVILAQTVIILTIDPTTKYVGMLSIPRDMQVYERGYSAPKLDEVFAHGFDLSPKNTPMPQKIARSAGHVMSVIEANYGIHIDEYAWVGLDGFVKVIDTAGGVDVDVIHPMVDDTYPDDVNNPNDPHAFKRLYIAPGPQHLDGVHALEYVRTRHSDLIGDFGRSIRQQQVLNQLKAKLATPEIISKAPELVKELNGVVQTSLGLDKMIQMANLARLIDSNKIERVTLSPPTYSVSGLPRGNFAPRCPQVKQIISKMFQISQPVCIPQTGSTGTAPTAATSTSDQTDHGLAGVSSGSPLDIHKNSFSHVHSLLDVVFMVTFESFEAGKV